MKSTLIVFLKKVLKHELINGTFYIFAGSITGSVFSFLFNLFLARKLSYVDYGIVTALVSFVGLTVIPTQSLTTVLVQYATNFFSKKEFLHASSLYHKSLKMMISLAIFVFFLFFVFSHNFTNYLHIKDANYAYMAGILASLGYISVVNTAFIQSLLKFGFLSFLNFLGSLLKIIFGILLVLLGYRALGVLGALVISSFVPFLIGFIPLRFLFAKKETIVVIPWKGIASYAFFVGITTFSLSSLISTDIILVKHFFSGADAGFYAGLSLVGKSIFYLTAPISTVLFPVIINKYNQGRNLDKTFYLAIFLVLTPSILADLIYLVFPNFVITLFLGGKAYLQLSEILWFYGAFIIIFSILNIFVTFFLSIKKTFIAFPMALGALFQFGAINLFHKNFFQVILSSIVVSSVLLATILLYYLKTYGQKEKII